MLKAGVNDFKGLPGQSSQAHYLHIQAQTTKLGGGQSAVINPSQTLVGVRLLLLVKSALGVFLSLSP